jgi:hypothetical protein
MVENFGPHPLGVRIQGSGLHLDPYQIVTDPEHCFIQHCLICHPSDFTMSENAGIEPRTVATSLAITTQLDLIHGTVTYWALKKSFTIENGTLTEKRRLFQGWDDFSWPHWQLGFLLPTAVWGSEKFLKGFHRVGDGRIFEFFYKPPRFFL